MEPGLNQYKHECRYEPEKLSTHKARKTFGLNIMIRNNTIHKNNYHHKAIWG